MDSKIIEGIDYKKIDVKYKYDVVNNVGPYQSGIKGLCVYHKYFTLEPSGCITAKEGYKWDGPSGITVDTPSFMRGSLFHDIFYQILRDNLLNRFDIDGIPCYKVAETYIIDVGKHYHTWLDVKNAADNLLKKMCLQDGMMRFRVCYVYKGVHLFGGRYCKPKKLS